MSRETVTTKVREYRLALDVDVPGLTFQGTVEIDLEPAGPAVILNAADLEIVGARSGDGLLEVTAAPEREEVTLSGPGGDLTSISVEFRGRVAHQSLVGLYRSKFGDGTFLTTQCAPTGARRIFPCIDRPDVKSSIGLDLTVGIDDGVIFNTPVVEQRTRGKRKRLKFDPTPAMSTYLFYLGIGPFELLKGRAARVRLSVAAPPGRSDEGEFALEQTSRLLPAYEEYFQIPYPLSKLDLVAVPEMFYGAMENWGAITFRDMRLLISDTATTAQRRDALSTITHEVAHQWFGNLVTMSWWTDIWLNESFATFMEPKMIDQLYPDSGALADFVLGWTAPAILGDSLPGTHPVRAEVEKVEEIAQIFDEISYGKGASILRMFETFLGESVFRQGVKAYLEKFRYGNATSQDLWSSLEDAAGRPVKAVLDEWVSRPGLPVISARFEGGRARLTQRRFSLVGGVAPESPWPIPLVLDADGSTQRFLFDQPTMELDVADPASAHFNPGGLGFYRVLYDSGGYHQLRRRFDALPPLHRWSILQDLYAFLLAGEVGLERYLDIVDAVRPSTDYAPVVEVTRQYLTGGYPREPPGLSPILPTHARFQQRMGAFLNAQFDRLGEVSTPEEPATDGVLRALVARALVWNDADRARVFAGKLDEWDDLDPNLHSAVAMGYARTGGAGEHAKLLEMMDQAPDEGTSIRLVAALASFREPALVGETLDLMGTERISRGHILTVISWAAMNPEGRGALWDWMKDRSTPVLEQVRGTGMASDLLACALPFVGLGREEAVRLHMSEHPWPEGDRGTRKGLDLLKATSRLSRMAP